ncbi:hypothetical protein [Streptomyces sp. NPDC056387]|uniref:hypothetical protein n=1 Tax=Streptomyces sp. NPDC056387 TaxID=3345803 RepID=UPI0035DFF9C5
MTAFDTDPEALAWARGKVQDYLDRLTEIEWQAQANGDALTRYGAGVAREIARRHFHGNGGDGYGVFDERLPGLQRTDEPAP